VKIGFGMQVPKIR